MDIGTTVIYSFQTLNIHTVIAINKQCLSQEYIDNDVTATMVLALRHQHTGIDVKPCYKHRLQTNKTYHSVQIANIIFLESPQCVGYSYDDNGMCITGDNQASMLPSVLTIYDDNKTSITNCALPVMTRWVWLWIIYLPRWWLFVMRVHKARCTRCWKAFSWKTTIQVSPKNPFACSSTYNYWMACHRMACPILFTSNRFIRDTLHINIKLHL